MAKSLSFSIVTIQAIKFCNISSYFLDRSYRKFVKSLGFSKQAI